MLGQAAALRRGPWPRPPAAEQELAHGQLAGRLVASAPLGEERSQRLLCGSCRVGLRECLQQLGVDPDLLLATESEQVEQVRCGNEQPPIDMERRDVARGEER